MDTKVFTSWNYRRKNTHLHRNTTHRKLPWKTQDIDMNTHDDYKSIQEGSWVCNYYGKIIHVHIILQKCRFMHASTHTHTCTVCKVLCNVEWMRKKYAWSEPDNALRFAVREEHVLWVSYNSFHLATMQWWTGGEESQGWANAQWSPWSTQQCASSAGTSPRLPHLPKLGVLPGT